MKYRIENMRGDVVAQGTALSRTMVNHVIMRSMPGSRGGAGIYSDAHPTSGLVMDWSAELMGRWYIEGPEEVEVNE